MKKNFANIEVIAQINDKFNNEYIAYEPIISEEEITIKKQKKLDIEMKIKPLIKYDDIIIGKDAENDYDINIKKDNK